VYQDYLARHSQSVADAVERLRASAEHEPVSEWELPGAGGFWLLLPQVLQYGVATAYCAVTLTAGRHARLLWDKAELRRVLGLSQDNGELLEALAIASRARGGGEHATGQPTASQHGAERAALLRTGRALGIPTSRLRTLVPIGLEALRGYAQRLPGFHESGVAHLWTNFLATRAVVRESGGEIRVGLAPPQLDVIWRLSGAGRARYALADGRAVVVDAMR